MIKKPGKRTLSILCVLAAIAVMIIAVCLGSVTIKADLIPKILSSHIFGTALPDGIGKSTDTIVWTMRLPRVLLAFVVGASLGVSGCVMQAVLRNPLASSYTIGVSAGTSLGVGMLMLFGVSIPFLGMFGYSIIGGLCGITAVILAVFFASAIDRNLENNTIILVGMVFSLFISAIITLITALSRTVLERLTYWQMGSFGMKEWIHVIALTPIAAVLILLITLRIREMDILTFGDEQASAIGINVKREKWYLLCMSAALTGASIAFVGMMGFIDLVAPHIVRRMFGAKHKFVLPMSAVIAGTLTVLADLIARCILPASELPVGAVTAILGAPFFGFVFFNQRRKG